MDLPNDPRSMAELLSERSDDEYKEIMDQVANMQRGRPESTMRQAQREIGSGLYPNSLEHVGDLTHRINERGGHLGTELVAPKVNSQLEHLTRRYGYEREMLEQVADNQQYNRPDIDRIREIGAEYADAHRAIPVINRPTDLGRMAAVNLGQMQFGSVIENLTGLKELIDDDESYKYAISRQGAIDYLRGLGGR
jgi:hypothetical protein